jgi:vancomycin permeability regulator SanA
LTDDEGRELREILLLPVTVLICGVWGLSAGIAFLTSNVTFFEVATGPFVMMCGYVFGVKIMREGDTTPVVLRRRRPTPQVEEREVDGDA